MSPQETIKINLSVKSFLCLRSNYSVDQGRDTVSAVWAAEKKKRITGAFTSDELTPPLRTELKIHRGTTGEG